MSRVCADNVAATSATTDQALRNLLVSCNSAAHVAIQMLSSRLKWQSATVDAFLTCILHLLVSPLNVHDSGVFALHFKKFEFPPVEALTITFNANKRPAVCKKKSLTL